MLTDDERRRGAEDLYNADRERRVIPQLSRTFPNIELEDASVNLPGAAAS
jgi:2-oxo-hept-3-ene-1,7-dioate hydratase